MKSLLAILTAYSATVLSVVMVDQQPMSAYPPAIVELMGGETVGTPTLQDSISLDNNGSDVISNTLITAEDMSIVRSKPAASAKMLLLEKSTAPPSPSPSTEFTFDPIGESYVAATFDPIGSEVSSFDAIGIAAGITVDEFDPIGEMQVYDPIIDDELVPIPEDEPETVTSAPQATYASSNSRRRPILNFIRNRPRLLRRLR